MKACERPLSCDLARDYDNMGKRNLRVVISNKCSFTFFDSAQNSSIPCPSTEHDAFASVLR
jgi:hypothetical protein